MSEVEISHINLLQKLHRTWVQTLIDNSCNDYVAILVDAELLFDYEWNYNTNKDEILSLSVYLPFNLYSILVKQEIQNLLRDKFLVIAMGHIPGWTNNIDYFFEFFPINYRVKLLEVEEDWQKKIKFLITQSKELNQALISEKVFARQGKEMLTYGEMKFASRSEIRIAQELERSSVLFFPLPLAVRHETGECYKDHREADFLVCLDGTFGILEVSHHEPSRYELDKEKDAWFKKSGILCIEHYSADKCYNQPNIVVNEFLNTLSKYKKL